MARDLPSPAAVERPEAVIKRLVAEYAEKMGGYGKAPPGSFGAAYVLARAEAKARSMVAAAEQMARDAA